MKIKFSIMAIACLFVCYSCKNNGDIKVPIKSMSFEFDDIEVGLPAESVPLNTFSATRTFSIDSVKGITSDEMLKFLKYQKQICASVVGGAKITCTTNDEGTVVKDISITASGCPTNLYVERCNLGTALERGNDFTGFFSLHLHAFFHPFAINELTLTVEGFTNVPTGKNLNIVITLSDVMFQAPKGDVMVID